MWDNSARQLLREAMCDAYGSSRRLKIFLADALDVRLARIAEEGSLEEVVFDVIDWADRSKRLDELFEAFRRENPSYEDRFQQRSKVYRAVPAKEVRAKKTPQGTPKVGQKNTRITEPYLISAANLDYRRLRDNLLAHKWSEADRETNKLMLQAAGLEMNDCLKVEDFDRFPCEDLQTIDSLWTYFSRGNLGFSAQKQVYRELESVCDERDVLWEEFGHRIGWNWHSGWLKVFDLAYKPAGKSNPFAHLPSWTFVFSWPSSLYSTENFYNGYWIPIESITQRLEDCNCDNQAIR